jgi:hypothetical protein
MLFLSKEKRENPIGPFFSAMLEFGYCEKFFS